MRAVCLVLAVTLLAVSVPLGGLADCSRRFGAVSVAQPRAFVFSLDFAALAARRQNWQVALSCSPQACRVAEAEFATLPDDDLTKVTESVAVSVRPGPAACVSAAAS